VCGIGSTGRIVTDIHKMLSEQGIQSYVAFGREPHKNCNLTIKIGTTIDFYQHVILTRIYDKHGFGSRNATLDLIHKICEINPDIIHLHNIHGYYIHIDILFNYIKKNEKKIVWTLHDCWSFTGHCAHFDYVGCEKWKNGCYDCPEKKSYPASILIDNSKYNYNDRVDLKTMNRRVIESLIKCGAFDSTKSKRAQLLAILDNAINLGNELQKDKRNGQTNLFSLIKKTSQSIQHEEIALPDIEEFTDQELLAMEKETLGLYLSHHPLEDYSDKLKEIVNANSSSTLNNCAAV